MSAAVDERTDTDDEQAAALAALDAMAPADPDPTPDRPPVKPKSRRSGTSGAARARAAKAAAGGATAAPRARTRTTAPKLAEGIAQLYVMGGVALAVVPTGPAVAGPGTVAGQSISGVVGMELVAQSAAIGKAWEDAAKNDPRIRDALEKLLTVSTFGQIVAAHLPVLLAGLVAGGAAPPSLVGFEPAP